MAKCKYYDICPGINGPREDNFKKPMSIIERYKMDYCNGKPKECAIFMVEEEIGSEYITDDLLPTEQDKAKEIINNNT